MWLKIIKNHSKQLLHNSFFYSDYCRLRKLFLDCGISGVRYLFPWHLYLDHIEIPITTRCNLRCPKCANLIPLYTRPYDIDSEIILQSISKICECFDVCGEFVILGGEPFLYPDLKKIVEVIPSYKCKKILIPTNATIIPQDSDLYEVLRKKNVIIILGNYPSCAKAQKEIIERLEHEKIKYVIFKPGTQIAWTNYGKPIDYNRSKRELIKQFAKCNSCCKSLLNGMAYYCPRLGHGCDLKIIEKKSGEFVDVLNNTTAQNRRQLRRLMWRHKPVEACKYCLRGTDEAYAIARGK